jgi:hypothetical protein
MISSLFKKWRVVVRAPSGTWPEADGGSLGVPHRLFVFDQSYISLDPAVALLLVCLCHDSKTRHKYRRQKTFAQLLLTRCYEFFDPSVSSLTKS